MRLPRSRRGKTPIDVNIIQQGADAPIRVRLTVGPDYEKKYNSDLDFTETENLIVMLQYHLAKAKGELPNGDS